MLDRLTDLVWTMGANFVEFALTWQEAGDYIKGMNSPMAFGFSDWRLPGRRELRDEETFYAKGAKKVEKAIKESK